MSSEFNSEYTVDISKDEQFKPEFVKLSPFSKIPVITDHDNEESIFESGAILMYLGEKSGKFYDEEQIHKSTGNIKKTSRFLYFTFLKYVRKLFSNIQKEFWRFSN